MRNHWLLAACAGVELFYSKVYFGTVQTHAAARGFLFHCSIMSSHVSTGESHGYFSHHSYPDCAFVTFSPADTFRLKKDKSIHTCLFEYVTSLNKSRIWTFFCQLDCHFKI